MHGCVESNELIEHADSATYIVVDCQRLLTAPNIEVKFARIHPCLTCPRRKLGCEEGRSAARWVDFSLFGHQIVAHQVDGYNGATAVNAVDGDPVPVPHFGLALSQDQFHDLAARVQRGGIHFEIEPHLRFQGQPGEQWTMFFKDPSGNCLEFKAMSKPENLFAKYTVV